MVEELHEQAVCQQIFPMWSIPKVHIFVPICITVRILHILIGILISVPFYKIHGFAKCCFQLALTKAENRL